MDSEIYVSPIGFLEEVNELIAVRRRLLEKIGEIDDRLHEFATALTGLGLDCRYFPSETPPVMPTPPSSPGAAYSRKSTHDLIRRRETAEGL